MSDMALSAAFVAACPSFPLVPWQLKERGQEVAAVRVWHEVKAQAVKVARVSTTIRYVT
jgi:hypothetical protein